MSADINKIIAASKRKNELEQLRKIILECDLNEELKWGQPCYTFNGNNIVIIGELKDHAVIGFFKGSLLSDPENVLVAPGKNTRSARSIYFTNVKELTKLRSVIKQYIYEAIEIEEVGLKPEFKRSEPTPEELEVSFKKNPKLKTAFFNLTPGRQRGYILYFTQAKQSKTRQARIEKYLRKILDGLGMLD
jgi:uncharacterized protein YdeI (YjbR/CyaY-like superfamily)